MAQEPTINSNVLISGILAIAGAFGLQKGFPKFMDYLRLRHENKLSEIQERLKELEKEIEVEKERRHTIQKELEKVAEIEKQKRITLQIENQKIKMRLNIVVPILKKFSKDNSDILELIELIDDDDDFNTTSSN